MIFDSLFQLMSEKKASDLFITAGAPIHIKIQGHTLPINKQVMDPQMIRRMLGEVLTEAQHGTFERERELNLSFGRRELGNFRVNAFWQRNSPAIVVRYIQSDIPGIHELNLPPVLTEVVMDKRGLVLVVGATGSGKSTTLASMLDHRNRNRSGHILTVEDPIEYLFTHRKSVVNQREVGIDTLSWNEALRNAMRQAPDCILIGEIRDRETMQAAISYSQTGHLCLATLHANNAYHALTRMVNFFPLENRQLLYLDLAVALRCIVSQRLVRKPDGQRVPAVEMLMNTRHTAELIERGALNDIKEAMEQSLAPGSQTFEQALHRLYADQVITLEEALANADSPSNLNWLINNTQQASADLPPPAARSGLLTDFESTNADGASFQEFVLNMDNN
ncbi:PilT/PilU family type 4a pilus ATPase [Thauera chlorobenzoica]|uniref:Twitching motility protein PilT n=1 Tax=Thauera chlorobenzoica TaxID=96773 RepID=A0A1H5X4X0_9RHOO|nr:PilT/PilU family type 4a pilus ATPase [Thauera chlorobenzoica]APR05607.1 Twitching motility protein PilT [Thauera chlorobenzoica]SEG06869.1 twitching motility protein PilU [Thauera chlorobenzoica]